MIATAYQLPFEVWHSENALSIGRAVEIGVYTVHPEHTAELQARLLRLLSLCTSGALSGDRIRPWESTCVVEGVNDDVPGRLRVLARTRVADETAVVLGHMLFACHDEFPVRRVDILSDVSPLRPLMCDPNVPSTYPSLFAPLPFEVLNTDPEGGSFSFYAELETPLHPMHERQLNVMLTDWAECVLGGGFGLAPLHPAKSYVEPDTDEVVSYDTSVEWAVFKVRADIACVHAVINALASFHVRCQPIQRLEIT